MEFVEKAAGQRMFFTVQKPSNLRTTRVSIKSEHIMSAFMSVPMLRKSLHVSAAACPDQFLPTLPIVPALPPGRGASFRGNCVASLYQFLSFPLPIPFLSGLRDRS